MRTSTLSLLLAGCLACTSAAVEAAQTPPAVVVGIDVAQETLDSHVGTYVVGPGIEIRVWREGNRLMLQATGQQAWPLIAESETVFLVPAMESRVTFGLDARGEADHLVLRANGQETRALRR